MLEKLLASDLSIYLWDSIQYRQPLFYIPNFRGICSGFDFPKHCGKSGLKGTKFGHAYADCMFQQVA